MTIEIQTDKAGRDILVLSDPEKYGAGKKPLHTDHVLVRLSDGHVFKAPPGMRGLMRLSEAEAEMVKHYISNSGDECKPNVFAGNAPDLSV